MKWKPGKAKHSKDRHPRYNDIIPALDLTILHIETVGPNRNFLSTSISQKHDTVIAKGAVVSYTITDTKHVSWYS